MAHNIFEHDQALTVGDKAWHGLDFNVKVADLDTIREHVFNWEPIEVPCYATNPVNGQQIPTGHKKIGRVVTNAWGNPEFYELGEVGANYQLLSNADTIDHVQPVFNTGLAEISSALTLFNGAKTAITFKLTEYETVPGDPRAGYIVFFNAHDGSCRAGWICTEVRVVCDNTRRLALKQGAVLSVKHTSGLKPNLNKIRDSISLIRGQFVATQEQLKELARITVKSDADIKQVVKVAFSAADLDASTFDASVQNRQPRHLDDITRLFLYGKGQNIAGVRGTGLALHEAFTEFLNHKYGSERKDNATTADFRLDSVLFGNSQKVIERADQAILALA